MAIGQDLGHGEESHTEASAADAIERLLSGEEEQQDDDAELQGEPEEQEEEQSEESGDDEQLDDEDDLEDEDEDEGEPEQKPAVQPRTRKLKDSDGEFEVTDDELEKGYLRTRDYTRKTQKLADDRRSFESEQTAVRAERRDYASRLTELKSALETFSQEPDWDKLRRENPTAFPEVFAEWQLHKQRLDAVEAERKRAVDAVQADEAAARQNYLAQERAQLLEAVPEWKDPEVRKKEQDDIRTFGQKHGFSLEELNGLMDHRALIVLRKAMLHDRATAKAKAAQPKVQEKIDRAKVVTPGPKGGTKPQVSESTRRRQRLAKTGNVNDAASAIELMLD